MAEPPLGRAEFATALHAKGDRYWREHPFHLRLHQGRLSEDEIRAWVANRWYYQAALPRKDAAIMANCPLPEVRRRWIARIIYQDGAREGEGGLEAWLRLAEAVGLTRAEVIAERHVAPAVRFATGAYVTFAPGIPSPSPASSRPRTWRAWKNRSRKHPASLTPRQLRARRPSRSCLALCPSPPSTGRDRCGARGLERAGRAKKGAGKPWGTRA